MRRLIFLTVGILFLTAGLCMSGCGGRDTGKPPHIRLGTDVCAECGMIIQDPRFASACATDDGEALKFDDIGCLSAYSKAKSLIPKHWWAHDFENGEWMAGGEGIFVHSQSLVTPMGYGIAAFSNREAAQNFLVDKGKGTFVSIIGGENEENK